MKRFENHLGDFSPFRPIWVALILLAFPLATWADSPDDFSPPSAPAGAVTEWTIPSPEMGTKTDAYFEIKGQAEKSFGWTTNSFSIQPGGLYRFKMTGCWFAGSGGCFPAGIANNSCDYSPADEEIPSTVCSQIIRVGDNVKETNLRVGQWMSGRTIRFTEPTLTPAIPVYQGIKKKADETTGFGGDFLPLASGERIADGTYSFRSFANRESGNFDRTLLSSNASFNSDRWGFGTGTTVVYRFHLKPLRIGADGKTSLPALKFTGGKANVSVGYYTSGSCVVEASLDNQNWTKLGSTEAVGGAGGDLSELIKPEEPVEAVYLRVRGEKMMDKEASFQVGQVSFNAKLAEADYNGVGETIFADVQNPETPETTFSARPLFLTDDNVLYYDVVNGEDGPLDWKSTDRLTASSGCASEEPGESLDVTESMAVEFFGAANPIPAGKNAVVAQSVVLPVVDQRAEVTCHFDRDYRLTVTVFPYFIQNYTHEIPGVAGQTNGVSLSWCEQDRKVPRRPKLAKILEPLPVKMEAAKNDFESFQVVVRPEKKIAGLSASVTDFTADGATIPATNTQLRYGYYHKVEIPTDRTCAPGWYVDALVPMEKGSDGLGAPLDVEAKNNFPVFLTVRVPEDAKAGLYKATLALKSADGALNAQIPVELEVWDFAIPTENRFDTAYGYSLGWIFQYHQCKTEAEKRDVLERYLQCLGDHRISPYDPTPMDGYSLDWDKTTDPPTAKLDFSRFDAEMERVFKKFHFTTFKLRVDGLGGGTFQGRNAGKLAGFNEDAPQYAPMMTDYLSKLETHLQEKGWLDKSYCYWFDEPEPKDYEFVSGGFGKLKKYCPGVGRMLTEEPGDNLCQKLDEAGGNVNIWCPISCNYNPKEAQKRMEKGEKFWWYVCCGPKAPYCTEFTDHPAHELRVWNWQAFERKIVGSLIWTTTWWNCPGAFPDKPQNPYLDPMCYADGSKPDALSYWGNGDGRFMYPPLSAAVPGLHGDKAVLEDPVCSLRWEILREGIEDYEMLLTLSERFEAKKASLSDDEKAEIERLFDFAPITTGMTKFTDDPQKIYERRREIAHAILRLAK